MFFLKVRRVSIRASMLAGALLTLNGCAMYSVAGQFENGGDPFFGHVAVLPGDMGTLDVSTADGTLKCTGSTQVTKRPSLLSVTGAQGRAEATCTDGRTFKLDFIQTSESGGHGQGIDNQGNIVQVYFNTSSSAVRARLDQARIDALVR